MYILLVLIVTIFFFAQNKETFNGGHTGSHSGEEIGRGRVEFQRSFIEGGSGGGGLVSLYANDPLCYFDLNGIYNCHFINQYIIDF